MKAIKVLVLSICPFLFLGHSFAQTGSVADTDRPDSFQNHFPQKTDSIAVPDSLGNKIEIGKDSVNNFMDGIREYNWEALMPGTGPINKEHIPDADLSIRTEDFPFHPIPLDLKGQKGQKGDNLLPENAREKAGVPKAGRLPSELPARYEELQEEYGEKASMYKTNADSVLFAAGRLDTLVLDYGAEQAQKLEGKLSGREELEGLGEEADLKDAFTSSLGAEGVIPSKKDLEKLDYKKLQQDHFPDPHSLKEAMAEIRGIKTKYSEVRDSRSPGEGTKRNSLKDLSFFQRWETGVLGSIPSFDPLEGELAIVLGYRPEKRWAVGGGPVIQGKSGKNNGRGNRGALSWEGYRTYSLFKIKENLFFQAEYQRKNPAITEGGLPIKKQDVFLGGLGTEFKLAGDFRVRSTVLYSINKQEILKGGIPSPWQINMGIIHLRK